MESVASTNFASDFPVVCPYINYEKQESIFKFAMKNHVI